MPTSTGVPFPRNILLSMVVKASHLWSWDRFTQVLLHPFYFIWKAGYSPKHEEKCLVSIPFLIMCSLSHPNESIGIPHTPNLQKSHMKYSCLNFTPSQWPSQDLHSQNHSLPPLHFHIKCPVPLLQHPGLLDQTTELKVPRRLHYAHMMFLDSGTGQTSVSVDSDRHLLYVCLSHSTLISKTRVSILTS